MYHYVRDRTRSKYPAIAARNLGDFHAQLDYIGRHHRVVTVAEIAEAIVGRRALPTNAAWLTFDDGYRDHYENVFPALRNRNWQGTFFPPLDAIRNRSLLDVNMIHFILASAPDPQAIIAEIRRFAEERGDRAFERYWNEWAKPSKLDTAEVLFIKRALQFGLPKEYRADLCRRLFGQFVPEDPGTVAAELYVTEAELREMIGAGMHVGGHGARHVRLSELGPAEQAAEIEMTRSFLEDLDMTRRGWVMCYPHGAYNRVTIDLLREKDCTIALTTRRGVANIEAERLYELPRLDTNEIPLA